MLLQVMCEVDVPDNFSSFQEIELKIKESVFQAGGQLMDQVMEKYEAFILSQKKSFSKKDKQKKVFQTIVGAVNRKRYRVFDRKEKRYRYPLDEWMKLGTDHATPALKEALLQAAVQRSYRKATKEVEKWTGAKRSVMSNWNLVQSIAKEEIKQEKPVHDWYLKVIPSKDAKMKEDPCPILSIDPDATYVKNQNPEEPDHEVKMAVMYTGKAPEGRNKKRLKLVEKQVVVSRSNEGVKAFFNRTTQVAMSQYGAHNKTRVIIHGDGDPWIKGLQTNYWDKALIRLDPWHVGKKIKLSTGLKFVPPEWWKLIYGEPDQLALQLGLWKVQHTSPGSRERERMEELIGYIKNNREGLLPSGVPKEVKNQYPGMFKRGSGTIESNIGHGIADRFKQRRMSWSKNGLDHLIYLREKFLNGGRKAKYRVPEPLGRENWRQMSRS